MRDAIGSDDAMHRRYNRWWERFEQPDPYAGSYDFTNPQSFNRYAYVNNDPVNFVDPLGLDPDGGALGALAAFEIGRPFGTVNVYAGGFNGVDGGALVMMALPPLGKPLISDGPQNPGEDIQPRNLLAHIFHLLDDNRCHTFVSNLINTARQLTGKKPYSYDAKKLAVAVAQQQDGGFHFDSGAGGGGGGGAASGDIFSGQADIGIALFNTAYGPRDPVGVQVSYALTALHEIIHLAGGATSSSDGGRAHYTDLVLAQAAHIMTNAPGYPGHDPNMPITQMTQAMVLASGTYWNNQLREYCTPQEYR